MCYGLRSGAITLIVNKVSLFVTSYEDLMMDSSDDEKDVVPKVSGGEEGGDCCVRLQEWVTVVCGCKSG